MNTTGQRSQTVQKCMIYERAPHSSDKTKTHHKSQSNKSTVSLQMKTLINKVDTKIWTVLLTVTAGFESWPCLVWFNGWRPCLLLKECDDLRSAQIYRRWRNINADKQSALVNALTALTKVQYWPQISLTNKVPVKQKIFCDFAKRHWVQGVWMCLHIHCWYILQ